MATARADDAPLGTPAYAETAPSPALAAWVQCHWRVRGTAVDAFPSRILPDGCADVIVDLSATPYAFAVGPMRTASVVAVVGRVDLFGVRFHPGAAAAFLDASLDTLLDRDVPLDALWGRLAAELEDALASVPLADRVAHAERILLARLGRAPTLERESDTIDRAVALTRRSRGRAGVRDVAAALGVGERWLERAFARQIGYGPKMLARVVRLQHAVSLLQRGGAAPSWTALAYDAGYADQAHLVREFRALAGVTPGAYAAERRVGFVQYEGQPRA
jgi:AraC-like DNA-binding protein